MLGYGIVAHFPLFPTSRPNCDKKKQIYKRNFEQVDHFLNNIQNIDWDQELKIDKNTVDNSFEKLLNIFELFLDTHAPLQRLSNAELKFILKARYKNLNGIKTSIKTKDYLCERTKGNSFG